MAKRRSNSADDHMEATQHFRASTLALGVVRPIVEELQVDAVKRLCVNHMQYSDHQLRGAVGEIAGFQKILVHLENRASKSKAVMERDHG